MSSNVTIVGGGSGTTAMYGGDHTAAELAALAAAAADDVDLGAMDVIVDNVALAGGARSPLPIQAQRCRVRQVPLTLLSLLMAVTVLVLVPWQLVV